MSGRRTCARLGCKRRLPPRRVHFCGDECYREANRARDRVMRVERYHEEVKRHAARLDAHRRHAREGMQALRDRRRAAGLTAAGLPRKRS